MSIRNRKREGTIPSASGVIKETREMVEANGRKMVITSFHKEGSILIYIGSSTIYCIDAILRKDARGNLMDTGELNKVRWDGECSLNHAFERGSDTKMILRLLLTYIKDRYPAVQLLRFTDMSTRRCDNGTSVNLAGMKLFTSGLTWYEDEFYATITDEHAERYKQMKEYANQQKQKLSWAASAQYIRWNKLELSEEEIREQYEKSETWQDMFSWIRKELTKKYDNNDKKGAAAFCVWLSQSDWFDNFLANVIKFRTFDIQFQFPVSKFSEPYQLLKGGHRRDRTHKKR